MPTGQPTQPSSCGLCRQSGHGMNRLGGLDLCDPCFHGGAARGAGARGAALPRAWRPAPTSGMYAVTKICKPRLGC